MTAGKPALTKSWFLAATALAVATGCHAHVAYPGQVSVITYDLASDTEVAIEDLRVAGPDGVNVWLEADAAWSDAGCSPVTVRLFEGDRTPIAIDADRVALRSPDGDPVSPGGYEVVEPEGLAYHFEQGAFTRVVGRERVSLLVGELAFRFADEHLYNLRAFAGELSCPTPASL